MSATGSDQVVTETDAEVSMQPDAVEIKRRYEPELVAENVGEVAPFIGPELSNH